MDLKKEIKLSDLFRRNGQDAADGNGADASPEGETKARRMFSRGPKEPKAPKAPKEPKEPKVGNGRFGGEAKTAPPIPHIPLMRAFDLLPKEQVRSAVDRRVGVAQIAIAVVAVVALGALGALFLTTDSSLKDKRSESAQLEAQLAALQVQARERSSGGTSGLEGERLARTTALATALSGRVAWDRLLRDISLVLPSDVFLTALTVQSPTPAVAPAAAVAPAGGTPVTHFAIAGSTDEQQDVALLLSRLAILPELSGVQLVSSLRGDEGDIVFTINAAVRHEAATP
jgi:Tfp pilus assembly protein PilN